MIDLTLGICILWRWSVSGLAVFRSATAQILPVSLPSPQSYTLTYERVKLNISGGSYPAREWDLLFEAAQKAIAINQASEMLSRLREDASGRFKLLAAGHSEWQQLTKALEQQDRALLTPP